MLGLQRDGLAVAQRLAVLSAGRAVEEVSAIELKSWLVGEHLKKTTALWLIDGSIELHSALLLAVNAEIVVVACPVRELLVFLAYALSDCMRFPEVERRALHRCNLRNRVFVNRNVCGGVDNHLVVKNCPVALALEVEERMVRDVEICRFVGRRTIVEDKVVFRVQKVA